LNFNIIDIDNSVTISGLPEGSKFNIVYFINFRGKWYAIGLTSDYYVVLLDTNGPQSNSLTFIRTLYHVELESPVYGERVTAHVVTDLVNDYVIVAVKDTYILLDSSLENIVLSGNISMDSYIHFFSVDTEIILAKSKISYTTVYPPVIW
jgi:hypothetical protein